MAGSASSSPPPSPSPPSPPSPPSLAPPAHAPARSRPEPAAGAARGPARHDHRGMANRLVHDLDLRPQPGGHPPVRAGRRLAAGPLPVDGQIHRRDADLVAARPAPRGHRPDSPEAVRTPRPH